MSAYYRPLVRYDILRPADALPLAGGEGWFTEALELSRGARPRRVGLDAIPEPWRIRLSAPRPGVSGLIFDRPRIMGILNVTPDSFSDGGANPTAAAALKRARDMVAAGADIIDVGGESTRPGAEAVPPEAEIARVVPVVRALVHEIAPPISIDTRKSAVAEAAVGAGARIVNDVSGFTYDPMLAHYCVQAGLPVCVMHSPATPDRMQQQAQYEDVLLDVYDFLDAQVTRLEGMGLPRARIMVDPGIGFGKTVTHNLRLLRHLALFHGLGCPVLLGASRKGFIGKLTGAHPATARAPGSIACALAAVAQGVQVLRVHDVEETAQALTLWQAITRGEQ